MYAMYIFIPFMVGSYALQGSISYEGFLLSCFAWLWGAAALIVFILCAFIAPVAAYVKFSE